MRIPVALVIYVSLTAVGVCITPDWATIHAAGLAAAQHRNYDEAIQCFKQSWPLSRTALERGISASDLGQIYRVTGRTKEAKEWMEQAYDAWRADPPPGHNLALVAASLGDLYRDTGDYGRAERFLHEALLSLKDSKRGHRPELTDMIRNNLADLLREEGRSDEARELFMESLQSEDILWEQRVNALTGLADIDRHLGDWNASAKRWNEVLEIAGEHQDKGIEGLASLGLASMWLDAGNPGRAEPLFRRAVAIAENSSAPRPVQLATALSGLASLYRAQNKLALAEDAWLKALQIERTTLGEHHPQVAWLMEMLAEVYSARGERDLARDYATQAVDGNLETFGDHTLPTAVALSNRGVVEQRAGEFDAAERDFARAVSIAREHPGNDLVEKGMIERYAALLKAMHRNRARPRKRV
jgi:tetratricopeptide (TPR) repeat protein